MNELHIDVDAEDEIVVATLRGDIDLVNHAEVHEGLLRAALDGGPLLILDLNGLGYVDSNGVRMLFRLAREFDRSRISCAVALASDSPLQRLLKVTAFDEVVQILPSVDDALAALRNGG